MKSFKKTDSETLRRLMKLLTMSSMPREEKALWFKLMPELNNEELEKLTGILSREVENMTQLWLDVLAKRK